MHFQTTGSQNLFKMAENEECSSCNMECSSTDQTVISSPYVFQTQSSVPNIPAGQLSRGSPVPVRAKPMSDSRFHRRHNSFSGGIDANVVPLNEGHSASLLEIATNLLKNAPVALCGGQYRNEDELVLLPNQKGVERYFCT